MYSTNYDSRYFDVIKVNGVHTNKPISVTTVIDKGEDKHMETTYHATLDIIVFVGEKGKILGYTLHPDAVKKYNVDNFPKDNAPKGTLCTLTLNDVHTQIRVKVEKDLKEILYFIMKPYTLTLEELIMKEMDKAAADKCPLDAYNGGDITCDTCQFEEYCTESAIVTANIEYTKNFNTNRDDVDRTLIEYYHGWGEM